MRTAALILGALAASCGRGDPPQVNERAGGVVLAVEGAVSAEGEDGARPLAVHDKVFGEESVVTGADGSVRIRLGHNRAVLDLGPDKRVVLQESAAWRAAPVSAGALERQERDRTEVAGRHAEPAAADTAGTAMALDEGKMGKRDGERGDERYEIRGDEDPPKPKRPGGSGATESPPRSGGGACDEVSCLLADKPAPCCRKYRRPSGGGSSGSADTLSRSDVVAGIRKLSGELAACGAAARIEAKTTLEARIRIAGSGAVEAVEIDDASGPLAECVIGALRKARFPRSAKGLTVTYPIVIQPSP